jgi:hypothetical protein
VDQVGQVRAVSELLAQRTMERVLDLVVQSLDVDQLAQQVDVNKLLSQLDVNEVIKAIDVNALLSRVDVQALAERVDIAALVERTDLGAAVIMASGPVTARAVDQFRGQAVALDGRIDRLARRLLRRRGPGPAGPRALVPPSPPPGAGAGAW